MPFQIAPGFLSIGKVLCKIHQKSDNAG